MTGLRRKSWRVLASTAIERFTAATVMAPTSQFNVVTVTDTYPGHPQTPVLRVVQPAPGVFSLRARVAGYDLFGSYQVETSPICPIEAKTNNYIYFSRVFAQVTSCSYSEVTPTAGATISFGLSADPKKLVDAANAHYATRNHGYGVPHLIAPHDPYGLALSKHGATGAAMRDPCAGISAMNQTTLQEWAIKAGGVEVGANVAGWPGTTEKVGIVDWSKIVDFVGAPAAYAVGDLVSYHFTTRTRL